MDALIEALRTQIRDKSQQIANLKAGEIKTEKRTVWRYVDDKFGRLHGNAYRYRSDAPNPDDVEYKEVEIDFIVNHIRPTSKCWQEYLALKDQVSILLTARVCAATSPGNRTSTCSASRRAASTNCGSLSSTNACRGVAVTSRFAVHTSRDMASKVTIDGGGEVRRQNV